MIDIIDQIVHSNRTAAPVTEQHLVLQKIRLLARRRIAWLRKIWAETLQNGNKDFTAHIEVDGYLAQIDDPVRERQWMEQDPAMQEVGNAIRATDSALASVTGSRLLMLARIFGLNQAEQHLLQTCFALAIDPDLGKVFMYMQDHSGRSYVTETLVSKLFDHPQPGWFRPASPLRAWNLIREIAGSNGEPDRIECDPFIKNWLLGYNDMGEPLSTAAKLQAPQQALADWPVKKTVEHVKRILSDDRHQRVRVHVTGAEGSGRKTFAAIVCQSLGFGVTGIDINQAAEHRQQLLYLQAQRYAFLTNTVPAWYRSDGEEIIPSITIDSFALQFFIGLPGNHLPPDPSFIDIRVEIPVIRFDERMSLWRQWVPQSVTWPPGELHEMVEKYQSTIGQIVSLGRKKCDSIAEAYEALKQDAAHRLGKLAQLNNGSFTWDDLVVSDTVKDTIEDFTFEATERIHFWEQFAAQRLFPQGRSLIALFTGSPGTGKTMAAQVIASTLKLDLFRVDLSAVVSKYIGESSKNLERILSQARSMDIVLLFDEADALFGKRTDVKDAHDRYANTDTNYLLQAIEQYPGIVILSSNRKSNVDPAFIRRFRYVVDFQKPDQAQRLQLWRSIIHQLAGDKAVLMLHGDLRVFSQLLEMTGAQIKQAVLSAIFMARKEKAALHTSHLLRAVERELVKEGKSMNKELQQHFNWFYS
ncbi:MAG: ATP-binding protein [Niastella sp.]|nr:ATP-binding protein [Niastella sp.]